MSTWTWKDGDRAKNPGLRLRYEPGGWGDLFKALWLEPLVRALLGALPAGEPLRYGDPFSGAPRYPLTGDAAARLDALAGTLPESVAALLELSPAPAESGSDAPSSPASGHGPALLRSSAGLVGALCGARFDAVLWELDPERRAAWRPVPGVRIPDIADGREALTTGVLGDRHLVLIDPYDLDKWDALSPLNSLSDRGVHLLLYLFNRSPQSVGKLKAYEGLVAELDPAPALIGRIPADPRLPRAWHELILIPGRESTVPLPAPVLDELGARTKALAAGLIGMGAVERGIIPA